MKKVFKTVITLTLLAVMLGTSLLCFAATEEKPYAYVNIYDGKTVVLAMYKVEKSDEDGDSKWTINDVLISTHNKKCKDGYTTATGDYGLYITKLWNIDNGGSYGFYSNNVMSMGVSDAVSEDKHDVIYAFVYADAKGYSDAYSFFDKAETTGNAKDKLTLTAKYISGFDPETYAPIEAPLDEAVIYFDGKKTEFKTDKDGKVEIELPAYSAVITAEKEGLTLIPPVCKYSIIEKSGNGALIIAIVVTVVIAAAVVCVILLNNNKRKKAN